MRKSGSDCFIGQGKPADLADFEGRKRIRYAFGKKHPLGGIYKWRKMRQECRKA